jgi:hypothetical protein
VPQRDRSSTIRVERLRRHYQYASTSGQS